MQDFILSSLPIESLKAEIAEAIKRELPTLLANLRPEPAADYLTRQQAATLLGVSLPTLNEWTKDGKVIGYRIGSRVRYKKTELEDSLKQIRGSIRGHLGTGVRNKPETDINASIGRA